MQIEPRQYYIAGDERYPNSILPVLHYQNALELPLLFPALYIKKLFQKNKWKNNWRDGIYTFDHYHSNTHEAIGVCKGRTTLLLGGEHGKKVTIEQGDVLVIPAGVAHKNLGNKKDVICVGGYPGGVEYDMNYGRSGERPHTDENIKKLAIPITDPIYGPNSGVAKIWATRNKRTSIVR